MAVDKLVDSTQLDAGLTSVANAIRTKSGGSVSLAFPADFVSAINTISGVTLTTSTIATIATEVTIKDFLNNNPLPLKYVSAMVFLFFDSDTAPTQGSRTWRWCCFVYRNSTLKQYMINAYSTSLVAPNSINPVPTGANNSYFGISDGAINGSGGHTNFYLPVGTKVIRGDVPLDIYGMTFDTTEI